MSWDPVAVIASKVQKGELKAVDLVARSLAAIDEKKDFKAVLSTLESRARQRAAEIDRRIAEGDSIGRLAGVPFIAKDNFLTFGGETTAASNILKGFEAPYQATAIERLEAEGAICVGKANLDAFGHGNSTENSDFGSSKNPHDTQRVPGGSSGGSAVSVVLGIVPFALGTDTGGSSRQPASLSGCIGYKPTYGLISRSGVIAMASSTDTVGALTNSVEDLALILDVMAGHDELDGTSINKQTEGYADIAPVVPKRIGLVKEYMGDGVAADVKAIILKAVDQLKTAGFEFKEVSLPILPLSLACYYILMPAEVSSNLSRYDGQHYGYSSKDANGLDESYMWSRKEGFGREAKRRIMIGTYVLSSGYYDAYYKQAAKVRTELINEFDKVFQEVDFLLGPTAPDVAFKLGENADDPLQMYLADIMTVAASLVGVPAISVPAGLSGNLPVGMQLMAPQRHDRELLALANQAAGVLA